MKTRLDQMPTKLDGATSKFKKPKKKKLNDGLTGLYNDLRAIKKKAKSPNGYGSFTFGKRARKKDYTQSYEDFLHVDPTNYWQ